MSKKKLETIHEEWKKFGFERQLESGKEYSWQYIQYPLNFIGCQSNIPDCKLYRTPYNKNIFLVESGSYIPYIWNISNLKFKRKELNLGLSFKVDEFKHYIFPVSPLLVKLIGDCNCLCLESQESDDDEKEQQTDEVIEQPNRPQKTETHLSKKNEPILSEEFAVTVTGKDVKRFNAKLFLNETNMVLKNNNIKISIKYNDIASVTKMYVKQNFIVMMMKGNSGRYEISFGNLDRGKYEKIFSLISSQVL